MLHTFGNVRFGEAALRRGDQSSMSGKVKDFRCGPGCKVLAWADCGPRWKSSQGGSRVGWVKPMGKAWSGVCSLMLF
jgi:hypothetical protein